MQIDPACWSELRSAHAAEVTQEVGVTGPRRPQLHQLYHFWRRRCGTSLSSPKCVSASKSRCTSRTAKFYLRARRKPRGRGFRCFGGATAASKARTVRQISSIMQVIVLGAAAGGGFPQWNCNCRNCDGVRRGTIRTRARTQSSIAVSANGIDWVLFNASPDVLAQIKAIPVLQPARTLRDTGIRAVLLVDGQIDHTTGLLMLREGRPLQIWCTDMVREDLTTGNPLFNILGHYCGVNWHNLPTAAGNRFSIDGIEHLSFTAVPRKSKAPPYSPHREDPHEGDNIGVRITDARSGKNLFYAPGLGEIEPHLEPFLAQAD